MPDLGIVDINDPLGSHPLNKFRRFWFKALPGLYGGLTYYDLCKKYNLPLIGFGDPAVSGWRRTNRIGQYGYVEFDGVNDQAAGPIGPSLQNNYTIAVSVYIDSVTLSHGCALKIGDTTQGVGIGVGNAATPGFEFEGNDLIVLFESVRWITGKTAIGTGWHRLAVSAAAAGTATVYLDGVQVASVAGSGPNAPPSFNAYVGGYASTAGGGNYPRFFRGPVDNATLYTKVLSASDVKEDYKLELIGFVDALNYVKRKPFLILASVPEGFSASINFRGSPGYVVDRPNESHLDAELYPVHRNNWTYGWTSNILGGIDRDAGAPFAPEMSGVNYAINAAGGKEFRLDLPAAGTYAVRLAIGDAAGSQAGQYVSICDGVNGPVLAPVLTGQSTPVYGFFDALGVPHASADAWRADNSPAIVTTSGPVLAIRIADASDGNITVIAHVEVAAYAAAPTRAPVGISGDATWNVRNNVGSTYETSWHNLHPVGVALASSFDVHSLVGSTYTLIFDVRSPVGATYESTFDVYVSVGVSASATWDVVAGPVPIERQPVGLTLASAWDVRAAVGAIFDTSWNTNEIVNVSGSATWDARALATLAEVATWDNRIPAGWVGSASWDLRSAVGLANGAGWGVLAPSRIAANALWRVRGRVGGEYLTRWHNRASIGLERSATWNLRGRTGLGFSAIWAVETVLAHWPVGLLGTLAWADRARIGMGGLVTWRDRLPRGLNRRVLYNVLRSVGVNESIRYHTKARVGSVGVASWRLRLLERITHTAIWNNHALAGVAGGAAWNARARVGIIRVSGWSDRRPVGMSLSGTWRDRTRVGISGVGNWRSLARVGPNLHTYWNVRESIGVGAGASWDLRGVVALSGAVRFLTFRATPPAPVDYDPAEVAAYLESRHGIRAWGTYPDPASVRIDHDYPNVDAMRATRGDAGIPGVGIRIFDQAGYESGIRQDPRDVLGRSLTGPDGRWTESVYLLPGIYVILYQEAERFPVADYLTVIGPVPGREPPDPPDGDINNPYYELDYLLSAAHGPGEWGPGSGLRGPSPVDHHYGGPDRYTLTRYGRGLGGVVIYIYTESDYNAGRTGNRYRVGHSRTDESGRWDWPVDLYPGRYVAVGWREGLANTFIIEVT